MSGPFAGRARPIEEARRGFAFPKRARLLCRRDFRGVYDKGVRVSEMYFAAFCAERQDGRGSRIGLTAPRTLGKAVVRNRIKRRLREAVRRKLWRLGPGWDVVIKARKAVVEAPFEALLEAVERLFARCGN